MWFSDPWLILRYHHCHIPFQTQIFARGYLESDGSFASVAFEGMPGKVFNPDEDFLKLGKKLQLVTEELDNMQDTKQN